MDTETVAVEDYWAQMQSLRAELAALEQGLAQPAASTSRADR